MYTAKRIQKLPPYLFASIDQEIAEAKAKGVDIINLGMGDPDRPTPDNIVAKLVEQAQNPATHRYPSYSGMREFRQAVADWYRDRFAVGLDPDTEVVALIGSKEGIAHISLCFVDPGDINLVPDPGYPVYATGTMFAGGESYKMPLLEENGFLPDLNQIPEEVAKKARLMFLNYPNNPTGAIADENFSVKSLPLPRPMTLLFVMTLPTLRWPLMGISPSAFSRYREPKRWGLSSTLCLSPLT